MPVAEQEQTEQQQGSSGSGTALKAAAAAAATGAAALAVRKALSHGDHDGSDDGDGSSESRPRSKRGQDASSIIASAASSAWESAQDVVVPMAEDAVAAAGKYLAENAPDVVRERLVPRFIDAFNEAS